MYIIKKKIINSRVVPGIKKIKAGLVLLDTLNLSHYCVIKKTFSVGVLLFVLETDSCYSSAFFILIELTGTQTCFSHFVFLCICVSDNMLLICYFSC